MKKLISAVLLLITLTALPAQANDLNPYRGSGRAVADDPACTEAGCPVPAPVPSRVAGR